MHHEEHVGEPRSEVDSVDVVVSRRLGCVDIATLGAVELHHGLPGHVRESWGWEGKDSFVRTWKSKKRRDCDSMRSG